MFVKQFISAKTAVQVNFNGWLWRRGLIVSFLLMNHLHDRSNDALAGRLERLVMLHGALVAQCDDITVVLDVPIVVLFASVLHIPFLLYMTIMLSSLFKHLKSRRALLSLSDFRMRDRTRSLGYAVPQSL